MKLARLDGADQERALELLAVIIHPRNRLSDGRYHVPATISAAELTWLARHDLDPRRVTTLGHDAMVEALVGARRRLAIETGTRRFLESLVTGRPRGVFLEAALLSKTMPSHPASTGPCPVCGLEPELEWNAAERFFDWHEHGSGIPGDLPWAVSAIHPPPCELGSEMAGRAILRHVLQALDGLPATATASKGFAAVETLGFTATSAKSLVETLAFAGVLDAPPHRGLASGFVSFVERDRRPSVRIEWDAPLGFWRGRHGVTWSNAKQLFGISQRDPLPALPSIGEPRVHRPRAAQRAKTLPRRPAKRGDLWAVRVRDDAWPFVYVWETKTLSGRLAARVEFVGLADRCPTEPPPRLECRGRKHGRWQQWAFSLEKTSGLVLVAEDLAAPVPSGPEPDRLPISGAKDLAHLADWCFPELDR